MEVPSFDISIGGSDSPIQTPIKASNFEEIPSSKRAKLVERAININEYIAINAFKVPISQNEDVTVSFEDDTLIVQLHRTESERKQRQFKKMLGSFFNL